MFSPSAGGGSRDRWYQSVRRADGGIYSSTDRNLSPAILTTCPILMVMSAAVVQCPSCEQPSRVPTTALGLVVACPGCEHQFVAVDVNPAPPPVKRVVRPTLRFAADDIPVVHPSPRSVRRPAAEHPDEIPTVHPPQATGGPIALALLPVGVPLLWLILTLAIGRSEFSFMAPVAIALGTVGLGMGLAFIRRWSVPLRMRLLVALAVLGYGAGALFFFAQDSWLERVREVAAVLGLSWREFRPPEDKSFRLMVPGEQTPTACPVAEWKLTTYQFVDPKNAVDLYVVAYGEPPVALGKRSSKSDKDAWFNTARDRLAEACSATVAEDRVVSVMDCEAREYVLDLTGGKRRVVRLLLMDRKMVYLAVEGQYLSAERADVQKYLRSFRLTPKK